MEINNIYKIGVGTDYSSFNELKLQHVVSQGWPNTGDLSFAFGNKEGFQLFYDNLPVYGKIIGYDNDAKKNYTLPRLINNIKTGDIILAFEGNSLVGITQIPEDFIYFYNENVQDYKNCLFPVQWVEWSDFCKDNSLQGQGGQGVKGIEYSGMERINQYCKLHWNEYISSKNIDLQPTECDDMLTSLKEQFEVKKQKSKSDFFKKIDIYNHREMLNPYIKLLESNNNLILTGAPGTGKTYLAKRIAAQFILGKEYDERTASDDEQLKMKEQCGFVQFHPSYDYTDFVEGLRPKQDEAGNVGFERTDGVFKLFCKKAIKSRMVDGMDNFEEGWKRLVDYLNENQYIEIPLLTGARNICVELNEYGTGLAERLYADGKSVGDGEWVRGHSKFFTREQLYNIYRGNSGTPSGGHDNYRRAIVKYMIDNKWMKEYTPGHEKSESSKYVFIIDEINRGEISKIFGELFFSIDPGYRGTDGRVKTQYQNLVEEDDVFYDGFYVPDNVYIIGTMNDIDRSVESMDFAFRRRFAFKEVTAKESQQMLDSDSAWGKDENGESRKPSPEILSEIKQRMDALNDAICPDRKDSNQKGIEGLSSAYHIGASYFLKLASYINDGVVDYQKLWDNHLKGLLFEYLRGMPDAEGKLETLGNAFFSKQS